MFREMTDSFETRARAEANWRSLYRLAGMGAALSLALVLLDMALSFTGGDVGVSEMSVQEWFSLYQRNWFMGLRNLGLFNVVSTLVTIPLYLALYRLHRRTCPAYAALALALFLVGTAIYASNNRALAMLTLSSQYAAAQAGVGREVLAVAGAVVLAQAEDFTPGTFTGFLLTSAGSLGMMAAMLSGQVFGKRTALAGLAGTACLLVFTVSVTFAPAAMSLMMVLALAGGLLMLGWNAAMARAMFRLGRFGAGAPAGARPAAGYPG